MILSNFKDFPRHGRVIGIDWGGRRCGVSVTDQDQDFFFVRPPIVVPRGGKKDFIASTVIDMAQSIHAVAIVVGMPLRIDGTSSDTTQMVREFIAQMDQMTEIPIFAIDEILSSRAAQDDMGRVRRKDIKEKLDSNAARVILENAIALSRRSS